MSNEFQNMLQVSNNDFIQDEETEIKQQKNDWKKEHLEISCPIFLKPIMRQILSVGKSIKLIRYLESIFIKEEYANKEEHVENLREMFKRT